MSTSAYQVVRTGFRLIAAIALLVWLGSMATGLAQEGGASSELLKQAHAYEKQQNYDAAEAIYRKVLATDPANPEALKGLGVLQQTVLKFDDSIDTFKRVLARHPAYPQVNFFLGLSYYGKHDLDDAIASFDRELKTSTAHPATRYYMALALEAEGRADEAITQLEQVAAKNPNRPDVFYQLARLHISAAFRDIDQLRRIDPDSYQLHALMGEFYSQEGHYEAAIAQYEAALKKQPDAADIHSRLGVAYWMLDQFEPAEKNLLLAVQESPDDPFANIYLGRMALRAHDYAKALPYLKRAVATHVEELESRILLGRCLIGLGLLPEAKDDLLGAVRLEPDDPRSHYMLAEVYQKLNQPTDRERELTLFNKLSAAQRSKGVDAGSAPFGMAAPEDNH